MKLTHLNPSPAGQTKSHALPKMSSQSKKVYSLFLAQWKVNKKITLLLFLLLSAQYLWRLYIWYALNQNARQSYHWKYLGSNFSRLVQNVGMQMPSEEREKEMKRKRRTLDLFLHHLLVSKVKGNHWQPSEKWSWPPRGYAIQRKW